jgi:hypothetical protein
MRGLRCVVWCSQTAGVQQHEQQRSATVCRESTNGEVWTLYSCVWCIGS